MFAKENFPGEITRKKFPSEEDNPQIFPSESKEQYWN